MRLHDIAFWFISFFLIGVLLASFINGWQDRFLVVGLTAIFIACVLMAFQKYWLGAVAFSIMLGAGYYFLFDFYQGRVSIPFDEKTAVTGVVEKSSTGLEKQDVVIALDAPYSGRIKATTQVYPTWRYGDRLSLEGVIRRPGEESKNYLAKEGVFGTIGFAKMSPIASGQGSPLKAALFRIKDFAEVTIAKALPPERAAFLSGLVLGDTSKFSKEFREKMSVTGTSHLVALSGYNITVIAKGIVFLFGFWLSRRKTFWVSALAIAGFVVMTGAEASVVRAAIMALIVFIAEHSERMYSFRNAIVIAAFLMVLFNPRILVWDVGFQLSFAAVMGLVYLEPAIQGFFNPERKPGFFKWRENLATTASAQLAVLPILLSTFGIFSPLSLLTNILILTFVPFTMTLGFLVIATGIFSAFLSSVLGWITNMLLAYEMGVINFFSGFDFKISVSGFGIALSMIYYVFLVGFIIYARTRKNYGNA